MHKLNPNNKFQVPSGNLSKLFEKNEPKKFIPAEPTLFERNKEMIRVEPPKTEIIPQTNKLDEDRIAFEQMVKDKLSHVDEVLNLLKEKQDILLTSHAEKQQLSNNEQPVVQSKPIETPKLRTKRTYYPITDTMWENVKTSYPDLPDSAKSVVFSDGNGYFLDSKNKKVELDNKSVLKLLNKK